MLKYQQLIVVCLLLCFVSCKKDQLEPEPIVHIDYKKENIPDFSYAGYKRSESPIPFIKEVITLSPEEGRDYENIQNAIDELSKAPLINDFRGAVLLKAGTYRINNTLMIKASGVILRGEGQGANGTVIIDTRTDSKEISSKVAGRKGQASLIIQGSSQIDYDYSREALIQTDF